MSPEALEQKKYSKFSDVWSFGITLWEIFSLGTNPYFGYSNEDLISAIKDGLRLDMPIYGDADLYSLMKQCWEFNTHDRPRFFIQLYS